MKKASQQPGSSIGSGPKSTLEHVIQDYVTSRLKKSVFLEGLGGSNAAFVFSAHYQKNGGPIIWLCLNNREADELSENLRYFLSPNERSQVLVIPGVETDPYRGLSPHPYISARRAAALWSIATGYSGFVIAPISSLISRLPSRKQFLDRCIRLELGNSMSRDGIISQLRSLGYVREDPVSETGEFSFRGGIVDVFSPSLENPIRLEFFGDEIDSIREFDPSSQRSIRLLESSQIVPMREAVVSAHDIEKWHSRAPEYWTKVACAKDLEEKLQFSRHGELFPGFEYLLPLVLEHNASLFDYFPKDGGLSMVVPEPDDLKKELALRLANIRTGFEGSQEEGSLALPPEHLFFDKRWFEQQIEDQRTFLLEILSSRPDDAVSFDFEQESSYRGQIQDLLADIQKWADNGERVVFVMPSSGMVDRIVEILRDYEVQVVPCHGGFDETGDHSLAASLGKITRGFSSPALKLHVLTHDAIFSKGEIEPKIRRAGRRAKKEKFISDFRDLKVGDYVVHIDHGIGVFGGLTQLGVETGDREFVVLNYKDEAKLYVPVDRLDLIQKYASGGEAKPRVDRLGGTSWNRTKSRIRKSMRHLAEELLKLYAKREIASGHAFSADDEFLNEFEEAFEYQETPDQISAIEETKQDMESGRPMDRLVCGDVGYGKTEVAMRAAFKAVSDGKQVALLAPTTVLAFQHFNTFSKRFEGFPVTVAMLSRFLKQDAQKGVLERTALGRVDILIGTHRILSKDVKFRDIGLIVVDEEQRFGVAQKERLKGMKAQVDVLTLSATPIPRTLNMSLIGIRDLSIIETPPRDRLAIQTVVTKFSRKTIRSAISVELQRLGQVFFVHNSVETIYSIAEMIQATVPEARIAVAHGQMKEEQLEKVMLDLLQHRFDVLVCTTIIENGLDIPRANTIIINRADHFGLSQLYQLRGRVGRSDRRAYAYLLIPFEETLTLTARKRLAAIKEFSELGSGFRLAAMDLEIRGAGNLLGGEQHGHIRTVGYELYVKLLEQTIRELRGEQIPEEVRSNIDLRFDIQIPEHYVDDPKLRLWLYKRVSSTADPESIERFREEMIDRFGKYPRSVSNLLEYARLRLKAQQLRVVSMERKASEIVMRFRQDTPLAPEKAVFLAHAREDLSFTPEGDLILRVPSSDANHVFSHLHELLDKMFYQQ